MSNISSLQTVIYLLAMLLWSTSSFSSDLPIKIRWEKNLEHHPRSHNIQISKTYDFTNILHQETLTHYHSFDWSAPKEGVFHFRINQGHTRKNIVVGSFMILAASSTQKLQTIYWEGIKGANEYTLRLTETDNPSTALRTSRLNMIIQRRRLPLMVEVYPTQAPKSLSFIKTYNAGLSLNSSKSLIKTQEKTPAPSQSAANIKKMDHIDNLHQSFPSWHLSFSGLILQESLEAVSHDKKRLTSSEVLPGVGFGLSANLLGPLMIRASTRYGQSFHSLDPKQSGIDLEAFKIDQELTEAEGFIGIDLLGFGSTSGHHLFLGGGTSYREITRIPLSQLSIERSSSKLDIIDTILPGGEMSYIYFSKMKRFEVSASYFSDSESSSAQKLSFSYDVRFIDFITLNFGGFYSATEAESCDDSATRCIEPNALKTTRLGGSLGFGASL